MKIKLSIQTWENIVEAYKSTVTAVRIGYIPKEEFFEYLSEQEIDIGIPEAIAKD